MIHSIKAKSKEWGSVSLINHTQHVIWAMDALTKNLGYSQEEQKMARYGAILHDLGKVNPIFQERLERIRDENEDIYRHEIGSILFLPVFPKEMHGALIDMVVAHHRSIGNDAREQGLLDLEQRFERKERGGRIFDMHAKNWETWSLQAIDILNHFGIIAPQIAKQDAFNALYNTIDYVKRKGNGWSRWKGLLIAADHLASATNGKVVDVLKSAFRVPILDFYHSHERKEIIYPLSLVDTSDVKEHTLVTAPTGAGKTDFLLRRTQKRVFYTLPFQASINAMYQRIKKDVKEGDIRVLHSTSRLTVEKGKVEERVIQDKAGASIKILTPFQLAAIAFGTRGYESIMIDIMGNDVILDEIHTYTEISRAIVLKIIEVLLQVECRVHIGTATMPTYLKKEILNKLGEENVFQIALENEQLDTFNRHIINKIANLESIFEIVTSAIGKNEKILIVFNTVKKSQVVFDELKEKIPNAKIMLIHSRFRRKDRIELEKKLKEDFNEGTDACIVVATQVVEVSLDISFDLMITEAAPLDSLIQRFGRINRKRNKSTIGLLKPIYVLQPPETKQEALPYSLDLITRSYEILPEGPLKEREIQDMLDYVYSEESTKSIDLMTVFQDGTFLMKELYHKRKSVLIEQLEIDSVACIVEDDYKNYTESDSEERIKYEIPVSYKSVVYLNLPKEKKIGSRPFIVPASAYNTMLGLSLDKIKEEKKISYGII